MNEKEVIEQLESLIEAWQLDEADLNQTDINAIKKMLDKNKQLKEQLESSERARKEAIEFINDKSDKGYNFGWILQNEEIYKLLEILYVDKGE